MGFFWCFLETIMFLLSTSAFVAILSVICVICTICWAFALILDFVRR